MSQIRKFPCRWCRKTEIVLIPKSAEPGSKHVPIEASSFRDTDTVYSPERHRLHRCAGNPKNQRKGDRRHNDVPIVGSVGG